MNAYKLCDSFMLQKAPILRIYGLNCPCDGYIILIAVYVTYVAEPLTGDSSRGRDEQR